jgi:chemotaxis protein histidine kinase CheA
MAMVMTDLDETELRELQRDYLRDVREKLTLLRHHGAALEDRRRFKTSFPVLLFIAHQLKGSGGSLGFPEITDVARQMSDQLNGFLDDLRPRPSPTELSQNILTMADMLDTVVNQSESTL